MITEKKVAKLLTREEFREGVFSRDEHRCVICRLGALGLAPHHRKLDAHHILERRLWPDGGYYLDNGASLCEEHHQRAESTEISCDDLRFFCGIKHTLLPEHMYGDTKYDKWGNEILPNGNRLRGELFADESVQKVLGPLQLQHFEKRVKYPRTFHVPWSPGGTNDDRYHNEQWALAYGDSDVVVTEKMDGENTTMYSDYLHARSIDYSPHPSRSKVKALHGTLAHDIPPEHRICGENMAAVHSIRYENLPAVFLVFSMWTADNVCLAWEETLDWAELMGLKTVPTLYTGPFDAQAIRQACHAVERDPEHHEGYVIRPKASFRFRDFRRLVGKYVRESHVQTHGHWMRSRVEWNGIVE